MLAFLNDICNVDEMRLLEFLNHSLIAGVKGEFERNESQLRFGLQSVSITTLRSLAVACVLWANDEKKVAYSDLRACAVKPKKATRESGKAPSKETVRKFKKDLRDEWASLLSERGVENDSALFTEGRQPLKLSVLGHLFDREKIAEAQFKLCKPRLHVYHNNRYKEFRELIDSTPGVPRMVGRHSALGDEKSIVVDYGPTSRLSRKSFTIIMNRHFLCVKLASEKTHLNYQGVRNDEFVVRPQEKFEFADHTFWFWEGEGSPDRVTPDFFASARA